MALLALVAQMLMFLVGPVQEAFALGEVCYTVADGGDRVNTLQLGAGGWSEIDDQVLPSGIDDVETIAYWPGGSGTLYGADANQLGIINPATGGWTATSQTFGTGNGVIGGSTVNRTFDDVDSLTFDPFSGILWGANRESGQLDLLFQINPATGQRIAGAFGPGIDFVAIPAIQSGLQDVDDMAISTFDGELIGIQNNSGATDRLVAIDKTTGGTSNPRALGPGVDSPSTPLSDMEGLGFHSDGRLFGTTGNASSDGDDEDRLWQIDQASGLASSLLAFTNGVDHESVDCLTEPLNNITGTVWDDLDADQTINGAETGTTGVEVNLYRDVNGDGLLDAGDIYLATKTTGAGGTYAFNIAATGAFVLDVTPSTLPTGHSFTTDNLEVADFGALFGQTDADNDFGHRDPVDLAITKAKSGGGSFTVGVNGSYDIAIDNTSASPTTGAVTVSDTLPAGLTFVSAGSGGSGFACQRDRPGRHLHPACIPGDRRRREPLVPHRGRRRPGRCPERHQHRHGVDARRRRPDQQLEHGRHARRQPGRRDGGQDGPGVGRRSRRVRLLDHGVEQRTVSRRQRDAERSVARRRRLRLGGARKPHLFGGGRHGVVRLRHHRFGWVDRGDGERHRSE